LHSRLAEYSVKLPVATTRIASNANILLKSGLFPCADTQLGAEQVGDKLMGTQDPEMPAYNIRIQIPHDAGEWGGSRKGGFKAIAERM
jgi:hypothetical protein